MAAAELRPTLSQQSLQAAGFSSAAADRMSSTTIGTVATLSQQNLQEATIRNNSASLLQDTVDQFEKVIDLERSLLRKSIVKLAHDLEETTTELGLKEEELVIWEQRVQQVRQDNDRKLQIARARTSDRGARRPRGGEAPTKARGAAPLGGIAEDDEEEDDEDADEVGGDGDLDGDDDAADPDSPMSRAVTPAKVSLSPEVEAVNDLALQVVQELALLRQRWQAVKEAPLPAPAAARTAVDVQVQVVTDTRSPATRQRTPTQASSGAVGYLKTPVALPSQQPLIEPRGAALRGRAYGLPGDISRDVIQASEEPVAVGSRTAATAAAAAAAAAAGRVAGAVASVQADLRRLQMDRIPPGNAASTGSSPMCLKEDSKQLVQASILKAGGGPGYPQQRPIASQGSAPGHLGFTGSPHVVATRLPSGVAAAHVSRPLVGSSPFFRAS